MPSEQPPRESDKALKKRIFNVLADTAAEGDPYSHDGSFARVLEGLTPGLRAMAATHWLDMSMSLDSLAWHFLNFGEKGLVAATEAGLKELGLGQLSELFGEASRIMLPLLEEITDGDLLDDVLGQHGKAETMERLHDAAFDLIRDTSRPHFDDSTIYGAWLQYARKHPERVFGPAPPKK